MAGSLLATRCTNALVSFFLFFLFLVIFVLLLLALLEYSCSEQVRCTMAFGPPYSSPTVSALMLIASSYQNRRDIDCLFLPFLPFSFFPFSRLHLFSIALIIREDLTREIITNVKTLLLIYRILDILINFYMYHKVLLFSYRPCFIIFEKILRDTEYNESSRKHEANEQYNNKSLYNYNPP